MIKRIIYVTNKFNKSVIGRMIPPKTKLFMKKVIMVQVIIHSVVHYPLQNLEKHESMVIGQYFVSKYLLPDLEIAVTFAIFIFSGKMPKFIDLLKIFSDGFFMSSYTNVIIFRSKPSWLVALFYSSDLDVSANSSSLNAVLFNVVFTVGRFDSKDRSL